MYAVVETGGHQYRVTPGELVRVEKVVGEVGDKVTIDKVLMVSDGEDVKVGKPYLDGATVTAAIADQGRNRKIVILKKKRRKGYKVKQGHKQPFTALKIEEING